MLTIFNRFVKCQRNKRFLIFAPFNTIDFQIAYILIWVIQHIIRDKFLYVIIIFNAHRIIVCDGEEDFVIEFLIENRLDYIRVIYLFIIGVIFMNQPITHIIILYDTFVIKEFVCRQIQTEITMHRIFLNLIVIKHEFEVDYIRIQHAITFIPLADEIIKRFLYDIFLVKNNV